MFQREKHLRLYSPTVHDTPETHASWIGGKESQIHSKGKLGNGHQYSKLKPTR